MSSEAWERFIDLVFGLAENLTWNFFSKICFRIIVFKSVPFFSVKILSFGRLLNFLIVLKTFLSK